MTDSEDEIKLPRGAVRMGLLVEKIRPLADYLERFVPACHWITLDSNDYDFILRWPKAAMRAGIRINADALSWGRFILRSTTVQEKRDCPQMDVQDQGWDD